jgi:DNA-binding TFAR19-related protein (PDSD5 family)
MSDSELERLRRRRLAQYFERLNSTREEKKEEVSKQDLLNQIFIGRAWEVFNATRAQYPQVANKLSDVIVQLFSSGRIKQLSGQELYSLLRRMGLRVKLKTTIRIKEDGKVKSIEEKMKE